MRIIEDRPKVAQGRYADADLCQNDEFVARVFRCTEPHLSGWYIVAQVGVLKYRIICLEDGNRVNDEPDQCRRRRWIEVDATLHIHGDLS